MVAPFVRSRLTRPDFIVRLEFLLSIAKAFRNPCIAGVFKAYNKTEKPASAGFPDYC